MISIPYSIQSSVHRESILEILEAALDAVDPRKAVVKSLRRRENSLIALETEYDLNTTGRVVVLGAGKACQSMAAGICDVLRDRVEKGIVIVKNNEISRSLDTGAVEVLEASHPTPDTRGVNGAKRILELATELEKPDLAVVLISGGASSLLSLPAAGISLSDLKTTTQLLLRSGADIEELNAIRRQLSAIKGGRLAEAIYPARTLALILSDVVGDRLEAIGSGPTVPSNTNNRDANQVLEKYQLLDKVPESVTKHLARNPKMPSKAVFTGVQNAVIGSNRHAAEAAVAAAQAMGFQTKLITTTLAGEALKVGEATAEWARELKGLKDKYRQPACFLLGGETTVTVKGQGKGGRNQELALAAAKAIRGMDGILVVAFATDGTDGPTDSAGAVATGNTYPRAQEMNLDPEEFLNNNDSYPFFEFLDDHIVTGPTRTNVADLLLIFAF